MDVFLVALALLCALLAIVGSVVPAIPGPVLAYASLWIAQSATWINFSTQFMWVMALVTAVVFVADYFLPPLITKTAGGSSYASWGSVVGMILGIFLTPVGMILGMLLGAFVAELVFAKSSAGRALSATIGAFLGFIVGTGLKLALCGYILYRIAAQLIS